MFSHLVRPKDWAGKKMARVAFTGHALLAGFLSTDLIERSLHAVGRDWPPNGDYPGFIRWISFPVIPQDGSCGRPVWVDFYVVPVNARHFLAAIRSNEAYSWVEAAAEYAILRDAGPDDVDLVIGWGAYTKMATNHGRLFIERRPEFADNPRISTTHGDAGSAALTLEAIRLAGIKHPRLAIIGANGAIGSLVSRTASVVDPEFILLIGRGDSNGDHVNLKRLQDHQKVVRESVGPKYPIEIHQDKSTACLQHDINVVIVATGGDMSLKPYEVSEGTLVLDVATPPACSPKDDWSGRLVLSAGCGQFADLRVIPEGFGKITPDRDNIWDCGAVPGGKGEGVLWGCTGETIARAAFRWTGHVVGQNIPVEDLRWCLEYFQRLGFVPQPPSSFGQPLSWEEVRARCRQ